jgi:chromosome transmission fidelity protein 1
MISILTHGIEGREMNFAHKFREDDAAMRELGETILQVAQVTPGGILLFFPSYSML